MTVADGLQIVLDFCKVYGNGTGASGSATAGTVASTPVGGGVTSTTAVTTLVAVTGSSGQSTGVASSTTTVTFNSGAGANKAYTLTGVLLVLCSLSLFW